MNCLRLLIIYKKVGTHYLGDERYTEKTIFGDIMAV
jgi:hypothetical protein